MSSIARIDYSAGNEHAPSNPWGRTDLSIEPDGKASLEHRRLGRYRAWRGSVDAATVTRVHDALAKVGFPDVPPHPVAAGATIRVLTFVEGERQRTAMVAWHAAKDLPGYAEAFEVLDSIVRQLSEDTVPLAANELPPVVTELVRVTG
jgi:hypothetical protein